MAVTTPKPTTRKPFANTKVSSGRSQDEVEAVLKRYGAKTFALMKGEESFVIAWEIEVEDGLRKMRLTIPLPDRAELAMRHVNGTAAIKRRSEEEIDRLMEREKDRLWRVTAAGIKGKLYFVDEGIELVEQALFNYTINPATGKTVYEETVPQIRESYQIGGRGPLTIMIPAKDK